MTLLVQADIQLRTFSAYGKREVVASPRGLVDIVLHIWLRGVAAGTAVAKQQIPDNCILYPWIVMAKGVSQHCTEHRAEKAKTQLCFTPLLTGKSCDASPAYRTRAIMTS